MKKVARFAVDDKLTFVIANDYRLLQVMSRFGISLGFGDKDIRSVCKQCGIDAYTFIALINYVVDGNADAIDVRKLDLSSLLLYLKNTHTYFLEFQFPNVRRHLLYAIDCSIKNELAFLVLKFYDEYVEEVRKHMDFEEEYTFKYVEGLLKGSATSKYNSKHVSILSHHHHDIEDKLKELKNLFIQYYPQKDIDHSLNSVIYELYRTQEDLMTHCAVEDAVFLPVVKYYESISKYKRVDEIESKSACSKKDDELSERERDVVICVAKGMSNKEIADKLYLSVNTVTTHRRNIARKLAIHTSAGITIYAIVNKLVTLEEVNI